jgi:putative intracellular protease/amidase
VDLMNVILSNGNLVTGQNPASASGVALEMMELNSKKN